MCRPSRGSIQGFGALTSEAESIAEPFFGDLVDAFTVWEVWRVNQPSDTSSALGLSKVESEGAGVRKDVAANWLCWVAPHGVRFGVHLVGDQHQRIVYVGQLLQVLEMAVQFLLPTSEHSTTDEFSSEVTGQRIDDDHLDVQTLAHALDFISQEHLVSGIVGAGNVDAGQHVLWIESVAASHLRNALRAEGVFGIDVKHIAVKATLFNGCGAVHSQLVSDLRLPTSEFTVDFHKGLGFEAATQQVANGLNPGGQLLDRFTQFGFLSKVGRRHNSKAQEFVKTGFTQLFSGRRSYTR